MVLHETDHTTWFSAANFVASEHREQNISVLLKIWISVFEPPSKFFSDNDGESSNNDFNDMCDLLNIIVEKTAAESPFLNELCERHNAVLQDMILRKLLVIKALA